MPCFISGAAASGVYCCPCALTLGMSSHQHFCSLPVEFSILVFWSQKGLPGGTRSVFRCPGSTVGPLLCLAVRAHSGQVLSCQNVVLRLKLPADHSRPHPYHCLKLTSVSSHLMGVSRNRPGFSPSILNSSLSLSSSLVSCLSHVFTG